MTMFHQENVGTIVHDEDLDLVYCLNMWSIMYGNQTFYEWVKGFFNWLSQLIA